VVGVAAVAPVVSYEHADTSAIPGWTSSKPVNASVANSSLSRDCTGIPAAQ
jgi:hypothetical protein